MVSAFRPKSALAGEPAWDVARLFPPQGSWNEWDYLALHTNLLVELTDGFVEVLEMPTPAHQRIVSYFYDELRQAIRPSNLGEALFAPMPVKLRSSRFREPDVMFMLTEHSSRKGEKYWDGADLAMEVVSDDPESRDRDLVQKRADYADAGVTEYWIIDPREKKILVLSLHRGEYTLRGEFGAGQKAVSALLPGFEVSVDGAFAAALGGA